MFFFFFNDTATTEIYTLSLHDALPICFRLVDEVVVTDRRLAEPDGTRATKIGNARFGADACSRERDNAFGLLYQFGGVLYVLFEGEHCSIPGRWMQRTRIAVRL